MDTVHDATPAGTPVPIGQCPHCQGFLWVTMRAKPPIALPPAEAAPPPSGCCTCPFCGARIYVHLGRLPPVAQPAKPRSTALIPKPVDQNATTKQQRSR